MKFHTETASDIKNSALEELILSKTSTHFSILLESQRVNSEFFSLIRMGKLINSQNKFQVFCTKLNKGKKQLFPYIYADIQYFFLKNCKIFCHGQVPSFLMKTFRSFKGDFPWKLVIF